MELYLQAGYGMKALCLELLARWDGGTVILSPRDMEEDDLITAARAMMKHRGKVLIDPQLYWPKVKHSRLITHSYWPKSSDTGTLLDPVFVKDQLRDLQILNDAAGVSAYIVPGRNCDRADELWLDSQRTYAQASSTLMSAKARILTISLSSEVVRDAVALDEILVASESWDADGFYVIAEHPKMQYLVSDPVWLTNLLDFCAGLKLQKRIVIIGYCNPQSLCFAAANVDAIASGTFLNVRSFSSSKFEDGGTRAQRTTWYYSPETFSEYTVPFLDIAYRRGVLDQLRPSAALRTEYSEMLFMGAQPSSTSYKESYSFRHYLHCLHEQCAQVSYPSFRLTYDAMMRTLAYAERSNDVMKGEGVSGLARDFNNIVPVNRAALIGVEDARGFALDREW